MEAPTNASVSISSIAIFNCITSNTSAKVTWLHVTDKHLPETDEERKIAEYNLQASGVQ